MKNFATLDFWKTTDDEMDRNYCSIQVIERKNKLDLPYRPIQMKIHPFNFRYLQIVVNKYTYFFYIKFIFRILNLSIDFGINELPTFEYEFMIIGSFKKYWSYVGR